MTSSLGNRIKCEKLDDSRKQCKIGGKLVLITRRKYYMSFQLVSNR